MQARAIGEVLDSFLCAGEMVEFEDHEDPVGAVRVSIVDPDECRDHGRRQFMVNVDGHVARADIGVRAEDGE